MAAQSPELLGLCKVDIFHTQVPDCIRYKLSMITYCCVNYIASHCLIAHCITVFVSVL